MIDLLDLIFYNNKLLLRDVCYYVLYTNYLKNLYVSFILIYYYNYNFIF